jgi:hypothetical protein
MIAGAAAGLSLGACSMSDLVNNAQLPQGVLDPSVTKTPAGAMASYQAAVVTFENVLGGKFIGCISGCGTTFNASDPVYMYVTGLLSDELSLATPSAISGFPTLPQAAIDSRTAPYNDASAGAVGRGTMYETLYGQLQAIRARSRDARGFLQAYTGDSTTALVGHMYALEGYADVLLAELYCSGIPLSTVTFNGDFQLTRGFTTEEVYQHALALFDSAITLTADSSKFLNFARMGRARAQLGLADYTGAAQSVASVQTTYQYVLEYNTGRPNFQASSATVGFDFPATEGNHEGTNGLVYYGDPRTDSVKNAQGRWVPRRLFPAGYAPATGTPWVNAGTRSLAIATGVEARLIEAEAALQGGGDWLGILNGLRTNGTTATDAPTCAPYAPPCAAPGTGGVAGLPALTDPGSADARVSMLFSERAHWLYLMGYRQGDMRRLIRQYNRPEELVYPVGPWGGPNPLTVFGDDVNAPVPPSEAKNNPYYGGCVNREA